MGGGGKPCDMQQACGQSNQQVLSSSKTKVHPVSVSEAAIALKLELLQSVTLGRRGDSVSVAKCGSSCQSFFVQVGGLCHVAHFALGGRAAGCATSSRLVG